MAAPVFLLACAIALLASSSSVVSAEVVEHSFQTTDVLLTANQPPASYYMAAHPCFSAPGVSFDNTTTTGIIVYDGATSSAPQMPVLPAFNDTPTAHKFYSSLTGHVNGPYWKPVPCKVDAYMFVTMGFGLTPCGRNATCGGPLGQRLAASTNNFSFQFPTKLSMLQAIFDNVSGIYTVDFPSQPPLVFDYTNSSNNLNRSIIMTKKSTSVKKVKFNSTVEIVMQNTALVVVENHPIHLHGFSFYVLAQGFGNYDPLNDPKKFNLGTLRCATPSPCPLEGGPLSDFKQTIQVNIRS
ncbi:hypothetical protein F0562_016637 [Nyssa sinensis]|uniref:Plastocyanin-like domain-containing protein n=1 Tax=Nyssa sinensis TaxID=561372 RepID=A0A5J4ZEV4_9ASTE|nr:hypothetical protein F0562_016637 [Nyssa sinensis]